MRIVFLGDIVGKPGRRAVLDAASRLRRRLGVDLILANGENASGGLGLKPESADLLLAGGVDALSTGNHVWKFKELGPYLDRSDRVVRPANFPAPAPGRGVLVLHTAAGVPAALVNLQGRTYMEPIDCPFAVAERIVSELPAEVKVILVDFHAEATSEKAAMGFHLDGRVSAVLGTHTHVPTADETILPGKTAFLSDLGMCGPWPACLGMDPRPILERFCTGRPSRFTVAKVPPVLQGAVVDIDEETGNARSIRRLSPEDVSPEPGQDMEGEQGS
ncbi:MAG: TIGR00282 family metallophosphoesterase [Desulfovibrionaceae bacterium]